MSLQNTVEYTDKSMEIPADRTIPPTDISHEMFRHCEQLKDITALPKEGTFKVKDMAEMFCHCKQLNHL